MTEPRVYAQVGADVCVMRASHVPVIYRVFLLVLAWTEASGEVPGGSI